MPRSRREHDRSMKQPMLTVVQIEASSNPSLIRLEAAKR